MNFRSKEILFRSSRHLTSECTLSNVVFFLLQEAQCRTKLNFQGSPDAYHMNMNIGRWFFSCRVCRMVPCPSKLYSRRNGCRNRGMGRRSVCRVSQK
ncbi:hypothetical protein AVEN_216862-1 [Araneus ventricosus]|uniref:Uncharacterized protein n=1 Tax=Araneus ventricosus TaxID=182803 RepID=A0A4Y2EP43_ARAVE|nr:hypothetical protein AVEN_233110-1 [Araneus ventricosus]GBM29604.1 hypothetical protein AVEN_216862-1 [Araneus ventricosus]